MSMLGCCKLSEPWNRLLLLSQTRYAVEYDLLSVCPKVVVDDRMCHTLYILQICVGTKHIHIPTYSTLQLVLGNALESTVMLFVVHCHHSVHDKGAP